MTKEDFIEERKKDKKIQKELKKIEKEIKALRKVKALRTRDRAGKDNRVDNTEQLEALEDVPVLRKMLWHLSCFSNCSTGSG